MYKVVFVCSLKGTEVMVVLRTKGMCAVGAENDSAGAGYASHSQPGFARYGHPWRVKMGSCVATEMSTCEAQAHRL